MSKIIIFSNDNNGIGFCVPSPNLDINYVKNKDCPTGIIVDKSVITNLDQTFFDAYELVDNAPALNIEKAKPIWQNKIRVARKSALEELDADYMKAQEAGSDTASIVTKKQTLRDFPVEVNTATTLDEIKAVWNDMLGDK